MPAMIEIVIADAAGFTDMRCGFNGLAAKVESALQDDPFSGHVLPSEDDAATSSNCCGPAWTVCACLPNDWNVDVSSGRRPATGRLI